MTKDPYLEELEGIEPGDELQEDVTKVDDPQPVDAEGVSEISVEEADSFLQLAPDVAVSVLVTMGRKNMTVKDLLEFRPAQIIEMDRLPTDPVDLVIAGRVIAKGELVDVEGRLGVRILRLVK